MSAAGVVLEPREESTIVQEAVAQTRLIVVEEKEEGTDRDYLMVVVAIILAFTFTAGVMGTILITLALRGSGIMGNLSGHFGQLIC